jgi:hypothetical protein
MSKLIKEFEKKKYEMAKEFIKEGKVSKGLRYLSEDIFLLWKKGLKKKEILEILNQELKTDIKFKTFESFFARHIKNSTIPSPVVNQTNKNSANALQREKNTSTGSETQNNNNKGAKAPDNPNLNKGGQNDVNNDVNDNDDILDEDMLKVINAWKQI